MRSFPVGRNVLGGLLGAGIGLAVGVGAYTFVYARGASYLTDDPAACANCHVMNDHHAAWVKSSHSSVAVCNDCHTPSGIVAKYAVKASNGFWHSYAFTTGDFPYPLRIKPHNLEVANDACRKCHAELTAAMGHTAETNPGSCVTCHQSVGHME
ncbi:MAG: cytochrome c nitrite reductase small subunit [Ignavibacteriales bacterium]|nr:cytochrome c nitrite reductase small subunit [Ignavibacteriales bacterium]